MSRDIAARSTHTALSTPKDVIDLYTKIPDYAQVKHLGNSEFINTLERLKDEFRQIRASLYEDALNSSDLDLETDEKVVSVKPETANKKRDGRFTGLSTFARVCLPSSHEAKYGVEAIGQNNQQYLSITSCPIHAAPTHYSYHQQHINNDDALRRNFLLANVSASARPVNFRNRYYDSKTDSAFQDDDELETANERQRGVGQYFTSPGASSSESTSSSTPTMSTTISIWSSNPEICRNRGKSYLDYEPPSNIEKRIQWRTANKNLSRSEPQLYKAKEKDSNKDVGRCVGVQRPQLIHFKAHPVPDHVHQPLFDQIMLRNKLRSEQVREESKQRLLAQVKPFSFVASATSPATLRRNTTATTITGNERKSLGHGFGSKMNKDFFSSNRNHELYLLSKYQDKEDLNNTKPSKKQSRQTLSQCLRAHHHNKTYEPPTFRAKPAPPRTRALMAAVRLREQQEYRELKKRLRAEALMKTSSLPPSMAARDKREKATQAKINAILNILDSQSRNSTARSRKLAQRNRRISTSSTDDAGASLNTEDEAGCSSDDERGLTSSRSSKPEVGDGDEKTENYSNPSHSKKKYKNFTSFGPSKCGPKEDGVFESTAVDNHASRLRVQAARRREQERIRREQEEHVRLHKIENRRQRLRVWHMPAWKHASSYSSTQDISMRCELRLAASILEKEAFRRDMNNMLTRVQSAPLLLEGVRERKYELCKKHREELARDNITPRSTRVYSPRNLPEKVHWNTASHVGFIDDQYGHDKSETAAIAEGSYSSNSDNESVKNIELDSISAVLDLHNNNDDEDDSQKKRAKDNYYENGSKSYTWGNGKSNVAKPPPLFNDTVDLVNERRHSKGNNNNRKDFVPQRSRELASESENVERERESPGERTEFVAQERVEVGRHGIQGGRRWVADDEVETSNESRTTTQEATGADARQDYSMNRTNDAPPSPSASVETTSQAQSQIPTDIDVYKSDERESDTTMIDPRSQQHQYHRHDSHEELEPEEIDDEAFFD